MEEIFKKKEFQNGAVKIICPTCQENNQTSEVQDFGSIKTLMYCRPFYDELGNYHNHDSNKITTYYKCSNGHEFVRKGHYGCKVKGCTFKENFEIIKLDLHACFKAKLKEN